MEYACSELGNFLEIQFGRINIINIIIIIMYRVNPKRCFSLN
jgi:hypothetical protein